MKTAFDQYPEYEYDPNHPSEPGQLIRKDDFQEFLRTHHGHRLEELEIIRNSFVSERDYMEPVKTSYLKAVNNKKETFVIKRGREKIEEKLKYQVIPGDYSLECTAVEVQSEEITKQLKTEFRTHPFSEMKISRFLGLYKRLARDIDVKKLKRASEKSSHPLEEFYELNDTSLFYLLRNCRKTFKGAEYSNIKDFIYRHKDNGVLLLKARFRIHMMEKSKNKAEAASAVIPAEVKKVLKKE